MNFWLNVYTASGSSDLIIFDMNHDDQFDGKIFTYLQNQDLHLI